MAKSRTRSSTPRLSEVARHVVLPSGVTTTGWPAVEAKAAEFGLSFRPWQQGAGRVILAKRANGKYAATVGGTGLSIPRQVGKTFLVAAIVFALCMLRPKLTVIWTAHRLRTAEETFEKMRGFVSKASIAPHVAKVTVGSGEGAIRFRNGSRILFGARERGFGRGFDEVDVLIFDEAQILTDAAQDDMVPATNQSRQPEGALLMYLGTPPKPSDPGEEFTRMRTEALSGEDEDTGWVEFGADPGFTPTELPAALTEADWAQMAKANPSFPRDTPREAILRMRKKLGQDSFLREGYGVWDDPNAKKVGAIDLLTWAALKVAAGEPTRAGLVVDVSPTGAWASIALASNGPPHPETGAARTLVIVMQEAGADWAGQQIVDLVRSADITEVALTKNALIFTARLILEGIKYHELTEVEVSRGCTAIQAMVRSGSVVHVGQTPLDAAVHKSPVRMVNQMQQWDQTDHDVDMTPLRAASTAVERWSKATPPPATPEADDDVDEYGYEPTDRDRYDGWAGAGQGLDFLHT